MLTIIMSATKSKQGWLDHWGKNTLDLIQRLYKEGQPLYLISDRVGTRVEILEQYIKEIIDD